MPPCFNKLGITLFKIQQLTAREIMKYIMQVGDWSFEVKQIKAVKTPKFGIAYTSIAWITITNGKAAIEGVMTKDANKLTIKDGKDIKKFFNRIGFNHNNVEWRRFSPNGKVKKKVKNESNKT